MKKVFLAFMALATIVMVSCDRNGGNNPVDPVDPVVSSLEFTLTDISDTSVHVELTTADHVSYAFMVYPVEGMQEMDSLERMANIKANMRERYNQMGAETFLKNLVKKGDYSTDVKNLLPTKGYYVVAMIMKSNNTLSDQLFAIYFDTQEPATPFLWNPYTTIGDTAYWFSPVNKDQLYYAMAIDTVWMAKTYPGRTPQQVLDICAANEGAQLSSKFVKGDYYLNYTKWSNDDRYWFVAAVYNNEGVRRTTTYLAPGPALKKEWWK